MLVPALDRDNQTCLLLVLALWFIIYNTIAIEKRSSTPGAVEVFTSRMLLELQLLAAA